MKLILKIDYPGNHLTGRQVDQIVSNDRQNSLTNLKEFEII